MKAYSVALFLTTLVFGLIEVIGGIRGEQIIPIIPGDLFGGFVLIVISAIFLRGLTYDLKPFFYFGSLMLAVFGILYTLVLIASYLDALIVGEDWNIVDYLRIEIFLLPLSIPGLVELNRERKYLPP